MPVDLTDKRICDKLIYEFGIFCERQEAFVYQVTNFEYAIFTTIDDRNIVHIISDLKTWVLGIVQELFPDFFHDIDQ